MSRKMTSIVILINPVLIRLSRIADIEPNMKAYTIRNRAGERRLTGLHGKSGTSCETQGHKLKTLHTYNEKG